MADGSSHDVPRSAIKPYGAKGAPRLWGPPYRHKDFNPRARRRFERVRGGELIRHLGREPSITEKILITRIVSVEYELLRIDAKLDAGITLSGNDIRGRLAAETRLRLDLQALGMMPGVTNQAP